MHMPRTIKSRQAQSLSKRTSNTAYVGYVMPLLGIYGPIGTCQWILGEPTKQDYRDHGSDKFKCNSAVRYGTSWCELHYRKCFKPLTPKAG